MTSVFHSRSTSPIRLTWSTCPTHGTDSANDLKLGQNVSNRSGQFLNRWGHGKVTTVQFQN
jgi:hypothetical protein